MPTTNNLSIDIDIKSLLSNHIKIKEINGSFI
jgi:hypothetical protein